MRKKTLEELRAFCEGYTTEIFKPSIYFPEDGVSFTDDWVVWGGYDINIAGSQFNSEIKSKKALRVNAYKAGWKHYIGEPLHSFTLKSKAKAR